LADSVSRPGTSGGSQPSEHGTVLEAWSSHEPMEMRCQWLKPVSRAIGLSQSDCVVCRIRELRCFLELLQQALKLKLSSCGWYVFLLRAYCIIDNLSKHAPTGGVAGLTGLSLHPAHTRA
jgi:hypothetical protein